MHSDLAKANGLRPASGKYALPIGLLVLWSRPKLRKPALLRELNESGAHQAPRCTGSSSTRMARVANPHG